jgi:hypothetical protein
MIFVIVAMCLLAYRHVLEYFFTSTDAFALIDTSRVHTLGDLRRIFTEPLMAGNRFVQQAEFYRPVATLSYSADYWLWNLEPYGYHLTDVLLHALCSVQVFVLARELVNGDLAASFLSAMIFAVHPVQTETVSGISERQDILVALLMMLSLATAIRARGGTMDRRVSIAWYALALGVKETAFLVPMLIGCHPRVVDTSGCESARSGIVRRLWPYGVVTLLFFLWRAHVLGGVGGYHRAAVLSRWRIVARYLVDFLFPAGLLSSDVGGALERLWIGGSLVCLSASAAVYTLHHRASALPCSTPQVRILVFLLVWLLAPLGILLAAVEYAPRYLYFAVAPASILLAKAVVSAFAAVRRRFGQGASSAGVNGIADAATAVALMALLGILGFLVRYSSLFSTYPEWNASGKVNQMVAERLEAVARMLPDGSTLDVYGIPAGMACYAEEFPHAVNVSYPADWGFESWLRMRLPTKRLTVVGHGRTKLGCMPRQLQADVRDSNGNRRTIVWLRFQ